MFDNSVMREDVRERRTEALMDIIELKSPEVYDVLQNAIGDVYPHVYMALIGDACDDDDGEYGNGKHTPLILE